MSIKASEVSAWYTAGEATKALSINSGRSVPPTYVQKLAQLGKIRTQKIHARLVLYAKDDIDTYRVETRGKKSGQAAKQRSKEAKGIA